MIAAAGPAGIATRLGTAISGAGMYQAKSEPSPKPVVSQTAPTSGTSAVTRTVYSPGASPGSSRSTGMPAGRGTESGSPAGPDAPTAVAVTVAVVSADGDSRRTTVPASLEPSPGS